MQKIFKFYSTILSCVQLFLLGFATRWTFVAGCRWGCCCSSMYAAQAIKEAEPWSKPRSKTWQHKEQFVVWGNSTKHNAFHKAQQVKQVTLVKLRHSTWTDSGSIIQPQGCRVCFIWKYETAQVETLPETPCFLLKCRKDQIPFSYKSFLRWGRVDYRSLTKLLFLGLEK